MRSYTFNKKDTPQRLTGLSIRKLAEDIKHPGDEDNKDAKIEDYFNIKER